MTNDPAHPILSFDLPNGSRSAVTVKRLFNCGYAGKDQSEVQAHIAELAQLGIPVPANTPTLYPVSPYLAQQTAHVNVQHAQTSGEAEWALVIDDAGNELLTCACDHTDRKLEPFGVAWSKNAVPDVLATRGWRLADVADRIDRVMIRGRVGTEQTLIQEAPASTLLEPFYWLDVLDQRGERLPGTILLSGTITMNADVDQFSPVWGASLGDPELGTLSVRYDVVPMPEPIQ